MLKRNGKVATATTNSTFLISSDLVSDPIQLTQYGLMAERHWREFLPKMVRELTVKGTLMEMLFEAQETTLTEMETLTRQLETEQMLTPQQAHDQAWENNSEYITTHLHCIRLLYTAGRKESQTELIRAKAEST